MPLAGSNVRVKPLEYMRCGVLQTQRRSTELVESRERDIEVRLVEDLAAGDPVTFDRQDVDRSPLGVEAFRRSPRPGVA